MELLRDRSVRLAATLAVAIAIPVAVLFYFQFRSISALSQSSAVVLRQLSQETANGITQSLQDALKAPYINVLLRVSQAQTEPLDLSLIAPTLDEGLTAQPFVDRYYVWSDLTVEHRDEVLAYDREHGDFTTDVPEAAMLVTRFKELAPQKHAISLFETTVDGRPTYFQAQLRFRFPARDKLTSFVALRVDAERLRREFFPAFIASHFNHVDGPTGFPPLTVTVLDASGRVVYPYGGSPPTRYVDERTFALVFFDPELQRFIAPEGHKPEIWRLRTGYDNQAIPEIVAARERPQRALMAMLAGVLALGVFFVVRAAAREVTRLIDNLLDFSKIEAGLRRYRREPGNLSELTRRVLDSLDSQFKHNQFTIRLHADDNVPVLIDPEAADQALENLLSNAMKYSPDNREIDVDVGREDDYGVVRVTDRGVGIPARLHRKIFRKFYRVQTDAGTGPQGTGLGLAIVDHVMRGHGGFVRVRSEPGKGSTFSLHFPLDAGETHGDEKDTGDRGRAADVPRSA